MVIRADFYGHVGKRNRCEEVCLKESNSKGQMLVDFAKSMEMAVMNMYAQTVFLSEESV